MQSDIESRTAQILEDANHPNFLDTLDFYTTLRVKTAFHRMNLDNIQQQLTLVEDRIGDVQKCLIQFEYFPDDGPAPGNDVPTFISLDEATGDDPASLCVPPRRLCFSPHRHRVSTPRGLSASLRLPCFVLSHRDCAGKSCLSHMLLPILLQCRALQPCDGLTSLDLVTLRLPLASTPVLSIVEDGGPISPLRPAAPAGSGRLFFCLHHRTVPCTRERGVGFPPPRARPRRRGHVS